VKNENAWVIGVLGFVAFFAFVLRFEFEMRVMLVRYYDECC
jgi:hypothetical protein